MVFAGDTVTASLRGGPGRAGGSQAPRADSDGRARTPGLATHSEACWQPEGASSAGAAACDSFERVSSANWHANVPSVQTDTVSSKGGFLRNARTNRACRHEAAEGDPTLKADRAVPAQHVADIGERTSGGQHGPLGVCRG